jgi:hypothetical protein
MSRRPSRQVQIPADRRTADQLAGLLRSAAERTDDPAVRKWLLALAGECDQAEQRQKRKPRGCRQQRPGPGHNDTDRRTS